jgi:hypothetical protein
MTTFGLFDKMANSSKLVDNTKFPCQAPKTDTPFHYTASDVFVDLYLVGQFYATLEALSCGKSVIGFKLDKSR